MRLTFASTVLGLALALTACGEGAGSPPAVTATPERTTLVLYDWAEDLPQTVLDAFEAEYGVKVAYQTYESQEEAVEALRTGKPVDVAVIEHDFLAPLLARGLLAELDFRNLPNFKNVLPNFRDHAVDPGNRHSVPYQYGTTGLLVRTDLVDPPVTSWADLWDPRLAGKVALRADQPRELRSVAMLGLGLPPQSEDVAHLEAAGARLESLLAHAIAVAPERSEAVPVLLSGQAAVLLGWADDYRLAKAEGGQVDYVVPREGALLWFNSYTVMASSRRRAAAERFINFLLRPEVSVEIANYNEYATVNEAALAHVRDELRGDPAIYPPPAVLAGAHPFLSLSPQGEQVFEGLWRRVRATLKPEGS